MEYILSPYVQFHLALKHMAKKNWYRKQKALAKKIGISEGHLSDIIKNKKQASFETQVALAQACGLSYENMLALGRKLHLEEDILDNILSKDTSKTPEPEYDLHGGWRPRALEKDWQLVGKALAIIQSKTRHSDTLIHVIESLYSMLEEKENK